MLHPLVEARRVARLKLVKAAPRLFLCAVAKTLQTVLVSERSLLTWILFICYPGQDVAPMRPPDWSKVDLGMGIFSSAECAASASTVYHFVTPLHISVQW